MYGLIGKMLTVPGQRDALITILIDGISGMPGCLSYIVAQDQTDPDAIWVTEVWTDQKSHQESLSLPSVQKAIGLGRPLIAGFGERFETSPIGGQGLSEKGDMKNKASMRNTKLIFIDGLPGLGKTTTASWVSARLKSEGLTVNLFEEHQAGHPLNVGGDLHPAGDTPGEAFFQRYTVESFIQESLEKWSASIPAALQSDAINILDSYPFQNSVRVLLQMDAAPDSIREYAEKVENLVMPLHPVLIYLNHRDIPSAIQQFHQISLQRGQAWTDYVVELVTQCPYAEARHLEGYDGVTEFLLDYKQVIENLMSQSHIPRIVLENCAAGWDGCYRQIETFLGLE